MKQFCALAAGFILVVARLAADGPGDNIAEKVRPVPPPGIAVSEELKSQLRQEAENLGMEIKSVFQTLTNKPNLFRLSPDVEIFQKAVLYAVNYNEFYRSNEVELARSLLGQGRKRLEELKRGETSWLNSTGLVVRGYRSKIDGSAQPYGLVIPSTFSRGFPHSYRLDFWFHGRGENLTELSFINDRQRNPGEFTPANAFVLHPYGRYCNGSKFAGEVDAFEALDAAKRDYPIDENRIVIRGFSLGGASAWHLGVHHAGHWAAVAPGAGFSETPEFLRVFQNEKVQPHWFEQKLWRWYNATDSARNLLNCPTVAYSGEIDKQKQAADLMVDALGKEGVQLVHIIGPQTPHRYHPDSKKEINRRLDSIVAKGRNPVPDRVDFTTYTLRYNEMFWVRVDELEQHWEKATIEAQVEAPNTIRVTTKNIGAFTLEMPPGGFPMRPDQQPKVVIDRKELTGQRVQSDLSWKSSFSKVAKKWQIGSTPLSVAPGEYPLLKKLHGLQGPVDDAFLDSFMMVRPSGKYLNGETEKFTTRELQHAMEHWRSQFRGDARIKTDAEITDNDIAAHNLVLWGDPSSNLILKRIMDRLPLKWTEESVVLGGKTFPAGKHLPVLVYPNPLNPRKYVVLNSGFTFREYDYLNNARQTPKLPDFAIYDISVPPNSRYAAKIVEAGFFDESWKMPADFGARVAR